MKRIIFLLAVIIYSGVIFGISGDGSVSNPYYGPIYTDYTFGPGTVYIGGIVYTQRNTLTILPGTTLRIYDGVDIWVEEGGRLIADGNESNKITFTADNINWGHLYIINSQGSVFNYCILEKGKAELTTTNTGGALYSENSTVQITNCLFRNNVAHNGGAVYLKETEALISNSDFEFNTALYRGSSIFLEGKNYTPLIERCKIYSNYAVDRSSVHGLTDAAGTIQNCLIYNNTCGPGTGGGGVNFGGTTEGGILLNIINCVIANNTNIDVFFRGSARFSVQNSVIWGSNKSVTFGWDEIPRIFNLINCAVQGVNSNNNDIDIVSNFPTSFKLNASNIASDGPNFINPVTYNYQIKFISPCRDKGISEGTPLSPEQDFLYNYRVGTSDIGAYEVQYSRWLGTTDNLWATVTNWEKSVDPSSGTGDIILPAGLMRYPTGSESQDFTIGSPNQMIIESGAQVTFKDLTNNGTLIIESSGVSNNGSLIVNGSSLGTGTVTYNRFLRPNDNFGDRHFFSSPMGNQGVEEFITANPGRISPYGTGSSLWEWNEESLTANWQIVTPTSSFGSGRGYNINQATGSNGLLKFTGIIVNAVSITATSPYANYNGNPRNTAYDYGDPDLNSDPLIWAPGRSWTNYGGGGWNLMGNPFTSSMNAAKFISDNLGKFDPNYQALYVYDGTINGGQYKYAAAEIPGPIYKEGGYFGENIQAGQGFFVLALYNNIEFNFASDIQEHNTGTTLLKSAKVKADSWPGLQLKVKLGDKEGITTVAFDGDMTVGLDPGYDVGLMSVRPDVGIYSTLVENNGVKYIRQALPLPGADTIIVPIGIDSENGGSVTFCASVVPLKPYKFYLEDRITGIFTDLGKNTYTITLPAKSFGTGRFFLHTSLGTRRDINTNTNQPVMQDINIWASDHKVIIQGSVGSQASVIVYDMQGKKIYESHLVDEKYNTITLPKDLRGIYLVQVTDLYVYSKKVVLL